ncbi:hypothetical protein [Cellvibrio japonicus]|nr:hypothetical protein [Cellvibrio japonicus]QEI11638.1 hypothetical protein FY117_04950 [Cellvibrio japonicus]QEI15212.1 hypothetical protein FY116_04950 [Cellvibrio japonicus]QEI18792.1 hypothetical protein FY115_04950 [Cellvibrio japonicus]
MSIHAFTDLFVKHNLSNRLGQPVQLQVLSLHHQGRDYVFITAPLQNPNFIGKNAETFAFQLRDYFSLDARRFELIEVREADEPEFIRWRFEWVGHSPLSARAEPVVSNSQRQLLQGLVQAPRIAAVANG